jgi:hypothetical protein
MRRMMAIRAPVIIVVIVCVSFTVLLIRLTEKSPVVHFAIERSPHIVYGPRHIHVARRHK